MRAVALFGMVGIGLSACAGQAPYLIQTPFDEAAFAPYSASGSAAVRGQAFLKTVGGDVKTCAGNAVYLMPATAYNQEVVNAPGSSYANRDDRSTHYTKSTLCDAEGRFTFTGVAPLQWIVLTEVTWGVPSQYGVDQQGGMLKKVVDLSNSESAVILTDVDRQS